MMRNAIGPAVRMRKMILRMKREMILRMTRWTS